MKVKTKGTLEVIDEIDEILAAIEEAEKEQAENLAAIHPVYAKSARNLLHYQVFRSFDFRKSQKRLRNLSLSRLANADRISRQSAEYAENFAEPVVAVQKVEREANLSVKMAGAC